MGSGILLSEGAKWVKNREALTPPFTHKAINSYVPIFTSCGSNLIKRWEKYAENGTSVEVNDDFARLTFDIIGMVIYFFSIFFYSNFFILFKK